MTGGFVFLVLALVSFAAMGILHKLGDRLKCQPVAELRSRCPLEVSPRVYEPQSLKARP